MSEQDTHFAKVLALDTATRVQSLALLDGDDALEHSQRRVRFNHGSTLLEHLSQTLEEHKLEVDDLDLIAVGIGPGSFTGLRVGLAIAKSLARAENIPIVGVSTLAALAYPHAVGHPRSAVCAMYDARRGEVYTGVYAHSDEHLTSIEADQTAAPEDIRQKILALASTSRPVVICGNGPRKYESLAHWHKPDSNWESPEVTVLGAWADGPSATALGLLGRQRARAGHLDEVGSLEPNYIRPTDAEINARK